MMVGGIGLAPSILKIMDTPDDILSYASLYIRIYLSGIIPNLIYNMGSGILRAVGDSKRPLYFLIAGCFSNIVLDILFVAVLKMGVAGAALATILSQAVSAVLVIVVLMRTADVYRLVPSQVRLDRRMLKRVIRIGLPAGLQSVMYSFSNIVIQASVNSLGTDTIAAWTAYSKIDSVFWMIISAFGISVTTFTGQNFGAGKHDRVRKGIRVCMAMSMAASVFLSAGLYLIGHAFFRLFTSDAAVISIGMDILHFLVPTFITYVAIEIYSGALRGVGDCWLPMLITCLGVCVLRIVWIMAAVPFHRTIKMIVFSYPLTWITTTILFVIYFNFFSRLKTRKLRFRR